MNSLEIEQHESD